LQRWKAKKKSGLYVRFFHACSNCCIAIALISIASRDSASPGIQK
jgi:hypothetical protein